MKTRGLLLSLAVVATTFAVTNGQSEPVIDDAHSRAFTVWNDVPDSPLSTEDAHSRTFTVLNYVAADVPLSIEDAHSRAFTVLNGPPPGPALTIEDAHSRAFTVWNVVDVPTTESTLSEESSSESTLVETLRARAATATGLVATGDLGGTLSFTSLELVSISTGAFSGSGFFKSQWQADLEGLSYTGECKGYLFLDTDQRRIVLKGALSGDIAGVVDGYLAELVDGSDVYDQYQATWTIGRIGTQAVSGTVNVSGPVQYESSAEYPSTELYVLQSLVQGTALGKYTGPLTTVLTHVRVASLEHPYHGEGFSVISYVSNRGDGQAWTYDRVVSPDTVELTGSVSAPITGIGNAVLQEDESGRTLSLTIERLDLGLPPAPVLNIRTWGPTGLTPGQTMNYMIEYRNDGFRIAEDVVVVSELPLEVEYLSSAPQGTFNDISRQIRWQFPTVPARSIGYLTSKVRVDWGLPAGTLLETVAFIPIEPLTITIDPSMELIYEVLEAVEGFLAMYVHVVNGQGADSVIDVECNYQVVPEGSDTVIEIIEGPDDVEIQIAFSARYNPEVDVQGLLRFPRIVKDLLDTSADLEDLNTDIKEQERLLACLRDNNWIREEVYTRYSKLNDSRRVLWVNGQAIGRAPIPVFTYLGTFFGLILDDLPSKYQGNLDTEVRSQYFDNGSGARNLRDAKQKCRDMDSHGTDSHTGQIANLPVDPNVKYGPDGNVSPGQTLNYRVEYENEGEGIAYGVYFTDTLDEDLDDSSLQIGPVISTLDGSIIAPAGTYSAATRTITWLVGEVGPGEGGYADFSVSVPANAEIGTEIINFATVYFPSVMEATRTNGIVSIVSLNQPPLADAMVEQLTAIGETASVRLDGSGSSDPDDPVTDLSFMWTVDGETACDGSQVACGTIEVTLSFGSHEVTLRVTDPDGAFDEVTKTVTVDPAQLSVFDLEEMEAKFNHDPPRVKLKGEIGLPFGVDFSELTPEATVNLVLASVPILPTTQVLFGVEGEESKEWKYEAPEGSMGLKKFKIDWKGMRFKFKEDGFPVKLESDLITTSETLLEVELKPDHINAAFTIDIGGLAQVSFDSDGQITASSVPWEVDDDDDGDDEDDDEHEVTLILPFPLLDTTVITLSGGLSRVILVGDDLRGSVGRFRIEASFDGTLFPAGSATTPRTLDLDITVGAQGYPGGTSLGPDDIEVKNDKWRVK